MTLRILPATWYLSEVKRLLNAQNGYRQLKSKPKLTSTCG